MRQLDLEFIAIPSELDERTNPRENPSDYLNRIVQEKAIWREPKDTVIAVDTIVVKNNRIYQKPQSNSHAIEILQELCGTSHQVLTGFLFASPNWQEYFLEENTVILKNWGTLEIQYYLKTSQPFDKAGSYGIQDPEGPVETFEGSFSSIMGFPMRSFLRLALHWKGFLKP